MTIRDWAIKKMREDSLEVAALGLHGVRVPRRNMTDAIAYFAEPSAVSFSANDLQDALREVDEARMIIVTRRTVDPDVYDRSRANGVCVGTFGDFRRALKDLDNIAQYQHPEEKYFRRRLTATRTVSSISRRGERAWEIERAGRLRSLVVVTHDRYELTNDGFSEVMLSYPKLTIDALVVTNPAAQGFGSRVTSSANQARIPLYILDDFIEVIREPWT